MTFLRRLLIKLNAVSVTLESVLSRVRLCVTFYRRHALRLLLAKTPRGMRTRGIDFKTFCRKLNLYSANMLGQTGVQNVLAPGRRGD